VQTPPSIAWLLAICSAFAIANRSGLADQSGKLLEIKSIFVDGRQLPQPHGKPIWTSAFPQRLSIEFGPAPGAATTRLRFRLEGHENGWHEFGNMCLMARFCDESGDEVGQQEFDVRGESPGWTGALQDSPPIHRHEKLLVPPRATRLFVVISSAGPPVTVGIYAVSDLVVSRPSRGGDPAEIVLRTPTGTTEAESGWKRDGSKPSMAKVLPFGPGSRAKAMAVIDDDPSSHAEWHNLKDIAPRISPNEVLFIDWSECYSVGGNIAAEAAYEKLPPGDYRFQLLETTLFGAPTGVEASIPIHVPQAFWETKWFWPAMIAALAASFAFAIRYYTAYKYRRLMSDLKYQRMMERERLRIARDIHDDLGARVTQISLFSGVAKGNPAFPEEARAGFEQVSRMSRALVSSLYQTIWAVNPDNDNLRALSDYLCQMVEQLCEPSRVRCRFHVPALPAGVRVSSQIRHNLTMAVKESVHNVIKHANAEEVAIRITFEEPMLTVRVDDDGCGIRGPTNGHGLGNIRRRLEDIGGTCQIENHSEHGTTVEMRVNLRAATLPAEETKEAPKEGAESTETEN
jgi:signal transduction histidine kinase